MTWLRQHPGLSGLIAALTLSLIGALWFFWNAHGDAEEAARRFNENITELKRLEQLAPYPSGANLRQMKAHAAEYGVAVEKLKTDLKMRVMPPTAIAPNEFQSRLRIAAGAVSEKARAHKVRLPARFFLGFDEFSSALPSTQAAPLLGQELAQIQFLLNILLDARIDALTSFRRVSVSQQSSAGSTASPAPSPKTPATSLVERNAVELSFLASQSAARKILNQIATTPEQFYIVRLLQVRNEKDKGPPRDITADNRTATAIPAAPGAKPASGPVLTFIVGNEHVETSARIEIVKFAF